MITNRKSVGWRFLLTWVFATYLGIVVSTAAGFAAPIMLLLNMGSGSGGGAAILKAVILLILSAGILWIVVGVAQWSILRRFVEQRGWVWVGATALAFLVITLVGLIKLQLSKIDSPPGGLQSLSLIAQGSLLGIAQWFVLRRKVARAAWWIVISIVSWTIAGLANRPVYTGLGIESGIVTFILFSNLPVFFGTILSTLGLWWFLNYSTPPLPGDAPAVNMLKP